jgi:hypothetical protein
MPDHSIPIRQALQAACRPLVRSVNAPDAVQTQAAIAATQEDLLLALREAGALLVAVENVAQAMAAAGETLRQNLLVAMLEAGAAGVETPHHLISWSRGSPGALVTGKVAPEFMTTPEPRPDLAKIAKALRGGQTIPGAVLRNAAPHLTVRAKKA